MPKDTITRPCKLPRIQIDTWNKPVATGDTQHTAQQLAEHVCEQQVALLVASVLRGASTIRQISDTVRRVRKPLAVRTHGGQLYMHDDWRIRFQDMPRAMQYMVSHLKDKHNLQEAFEKQYNMHSVESALFDIIGPARSEGVRCLLHCQ